MNIARFEKRLLAYMIDFLLPVILVITANVLGFVYIEEVRGISWYFALAIGFTSVWILYTLINSLWLTISNGRTLGGLIAGLRVVHPNLEKLTFKDALCRSATLAIVPMVLINAAYMLIVHTEKTVFDRMSKTVVVDWRNRIH